MSQPVPSSAPFDFPDYDHDWPPPARFRVRWSAHEGRRRQFRVAWNEVQAAALAADFQLPDELADDWTARWANAGLAFGSFRSDDGRTPAEQVDDLAALVGAVRELRAVRVGRAVTVTEYTTPVLFGPFRRVREYEVADGHVRLAPVDVVLGGSGPGVVAFLRRTRRELSTPGGSAAWFGRLGYDVGEQPLFDPDDMGRRAAAVFRDHVPRLSAVLGIEPPELEDPATHWQVLERVQAWCVRARRAADLAVNAGALMPGAGGVPAGPIDHAPDTYPNPDTPRPNPNPFAELRRMLWELQWVACDERMHRGVENDQRSNRITAGWDAAEAAARAAAAAGIPFSACDEALTDAKRLMREYAQVAWGNEDYPFSTMSLDNIRVMERLVELSQHVHAVATPAAASPAPSPATAAELAAAPDAADVAGNYAEVLGRVPADPLYGRLIRALLTADGPKPKRESAQVKREIYDLRAKFVPPGTFRQVVRHANQHLARITGGSLRIKARGKGWLAAVASPVAVPTSPRVDGVGGEREKRS